MIFHLKFLGCHICKKGNDRTSVDAMIKLSDNEVLLLNMQST
jgi:hypothetical protein